MTARITRMIAMPTVTITSCMSLAEILEELPKLTEEERDELRSRLDEYDPVFLSILQERVRGIESGERETIPADQVIAEGRRLAQELAQQAPVPAEALARVN